METTRSKLDRDSSSALRILLVDDAQMILDRLVRALLSIRNVQIAGTCEDVANAIESIDKLQPDLVILDISLRASNGWDVLRHVAVNTPETDVYMFSNDASGAARNRFMLGGAAEFFDKSLHFEALLDAVKRRAAIHNSMDS